MIKILLRQPRITMAIMRNVPIGQELHLSTLGSKGSQIKQTEWATYFNWHAKASKSLQDSKIA